MDVFLSFIKRLVAAGLLLASLNTSSGAVLFFVNDPGGFTAATTGNAFIGRENWESSTLAPGGSTILNDPLRPGVTNGVFLTGSNLAAGITAQSNITRINPAVASPRGAGGLIATSLGFLGVSSDQLSPNLFGDSFDLIVDPASGIVGAVSLSPLYFDSAASSSTSIAGTVIVRIYNDLDVLLGTQILTGVDFSQSAFLGILTTGGDTLRRINFATNNANSTASADDIFVFAVPEPTSALMMMSGLALVILRRRNRLLAWA